MEFENLVKLIQAVSESELTRFSYEENGVSIVENRPLARALYASCEVDREIPAEFYGAVAEILVYIYRQNHRDDMFQ